jgi:hypothetical protein
MDEREAQQRLHSFLYFYPEIRFKHCYRESREIVNIIPQITDSNIFLN